MLVRNLKEFQLVSKRKKISRTTGIHSVEKIYLNYNNKQFGPFVDQITAIRAFPRIKEIEKALSYHTLTFNRRTV